MIKNITRVVLLGGLCSAYSVHAESLLDIYRLAEQKDARFRAAMANRDAVSEGKPQARAQAFLPSINVTSDVNYNNQSYSNFRTIFGAQAQGQGQGQVQNPILQNQAFGFSYRAYDYALTFTQPLFRYDRWIAYNQADRRIQQANLDVAAEQQDLAVRCSERYFDVLAAIDGLTYAQAQKKALERQLDQAKQRFQVGLTAITDVQEAQAGSDRALSEEILAQNQIDISIEALREITGEYHRNIATLAAEVPMIKPEPTNIDEWTKKAVEQNLRLASIQVASDVSREEIKRQRAGHLPSVDIVGRHSISSTGGTTASDLEFEQIGLQLNLPIFQGGYISAKTREAEYLYQEALERVEGQRRTAHRDARTSYLNVMSGISRVNALKQAVLSNETAVKSTEAGFEVGTRTAVDVVTSERNLFLARRDHARAKYDYLLDTLRLKRSVGTLSLDELAKVDSWLHDGNQKRK